MCRNRSVLGLTSLALVVAGGCVGSTARPSASLEIEPAAVCHGDAFETIVSLDASSSTARLSLIPGDSRESDALEFTWELTGDEHEIVSGALDEPHVEVTMAGERPLGVYLLVRNESGGELATRRSVAITLDCETEVP